MHEISSPIAGLKICGTYHWFIRVLCLFSILGFLWFTGLSWYLGELGYALFFFAVAIFGMYSLITAFTTTCVDTTNITITTGIATYVMAWDEITTVETNPTSKSVVGNTLVFRDGTKAKAIVVSLVWMNKHGQQMRRFLIQQIAQRGLEVQPLNNISPRNIGTKQR